MKLKDFDNGVKNLSSKYIPKTGPIFNRVDPDYEKIFFLRKVSPSLSLDQIKGIIDRFKKRYSKKDYIFLDNWEDVRSVFGEVFYGLQDDFEEGTAVFAVWKYSAFLNLIPENLEKQVSILEKISKDQAYIIMSVAEEEGLLERHYHFDPFVTEHKNKVYLSNKLERTVKRKKNGKGYYDKALNGRTVPVFRKLTPFDLALPVIEKIIKEKSIKLKGGKS